MLVSKLRKLYSVAKLKHLSTAGFQQYHCMSTYLSFFRKLQNFLLKATVVNRDKFFFRPHQNYRNLFCDQLFNNYFHDRLESFQYSAYISIIVAVKGTSRENLYHKLESLSLDIGTENVVFSINFLKASILNTFFI